MQKVYIEQNGAKVSADDHAALVDHFVKAASKEGAGSVAGDQQVTVNGTTFSGSCLVAGARQTITFTVRKAEKVKEERKATTNSQVPAKSAASKKAAAKKAAPKK